MEGEELVIVGAGEQRLEEVGRHQLSVTGRPQILPEHYPDHPNGRGVTQPRVRTSESPPSRPGRVTCAGIPLRTAFKVARR